jgi:putative flippase GtrA
MTGLRCSSDLAVLFLSINTMEVFAEPMKALLYGLRSDLLSAKFLKYVLNALVTYPLLLVLTYTLTEYVHLYYLASYFLALCVSIILNFALLLKLIFTAKGRVKSRFVRYIAVLASFTLANTVLVKVITEYVHIYYMISIIIVSGSLFVLKFLTYNKKVFHQAN